MLNLALQRGDFRLKLFLRRFVGRMDDAERALNELLDLLVRRRSVVLAARTGSDLAKAIVVPDALAVVLDVVRRQGIQIAAAASGGAQVGRHRAGQRLRLGQQLSRILYRT